MRASVIGVFTIIMNCGALITFSAASNVAFDTAGDSACNNGWTSGSNGGFGWNGGWAVQTSGPSSSATMEVVPDPASDGVLNSPAVPDGRAWAFANTIATRQFASPLAVGQEFSVQMDGGASGIAIMFTNPTRPTDYFYITSIDEGDYILWESYGSRGGPSIEDTGVAAIDGPVAISLTESEAMGYVFKIQSLASPSDSASIDAGFPPVAAGEVEMAGNSSAVMYMNNMTITPEPSTIALVGFAGIGLLRRKRSCRIPPMGA